MTPLSEGEVLATLTASRSRIAAAAWIVVRDTHAAEDIAQNVLVKAMTGKPCFPSAEAAVAWAFVASRREAIDWVRRRRYESPVLSAELLDLVQREWIAESLQVGDSPAESLHECLSEIPEPSRRLLRLRYFEERTCKDIAAEMGIGLDAIYQRLSRLHRSLKHCIEARLQTAEVMEV